MKEIKLITAAIGIMTCMFFYACKPGNKTESEDSATHVDEHHHEGEAPIYACPMHPEITGKEGEICSKCGMKLEHSDNAGNAEANEYYMQFQSIPEEIAADEEAIISFTPKRKGNDDAPVALEVVHEKKFHLIVVSGDLSYFDHVHPEYTATGAYEIKVLAKGKVYSEKKGQNETRFVKGGDYFLFADYKPADGNPQVEKIPVTVTGNADKSVGFSKEKLTSDVDGYSVTLEADDGKWQTNQMMQIKAVITKGGKAVDANALENYLSAKAHMVVIRTETYEYLHVHPEVKDGYLNLHTTFNKSGIYRGWLQFKTNGTVHVADFTMVVQ